MTTPDRNPTIINGDLPQIAGRSWTHALFWLVLLAAAGVDVVTFYQVLVLVMDVPVQLVTISVVGFAVVALTLAHYAGSQARAAINHRNVTGSRTVALTLGITWAALGAAAFIVRLVLEPSGASAGSSTFTTDSGPLNDPSAGGPSAEQYLPALLFLVLYVATGLVSGLAGYLRQEPAARQYVRAVERRTRAAEKYAEASWDHVQAEQVWTAIDRARDRRVAAMRHMDRQFEATVCRLRAEAQLIFARNVARAQPPAVPGHYGRAAAHPVGEDATVPLHLPPTPPGQRRGDTPDPEETR
jgi:hypothetical protein